MRSRCSMFPTSGSRAGRASPGPRSPRWSDTCRRPGGNGRDATDPDRPQPDQDLPMNMPPGYDREKIGTGAPSLDEIFIRSVARKPDEIAFVDPADKLRVTGQQPRRLTFAEADSAVTTLATHFIESGLPVSSIVAVQLPNTVDLMITALAAWRA